VIFGLDENRNERYGDIGRGDKDFDRDNGLNTLVIITDQVMGLGIKEASDLFLQNSRSLSES
jgi:hypothetical protein